MAERLNDPTTPNGVLLAGQPCKNTNSEGHSKQEHNMNSAKLELGHIVYCACPISSLGVSKTRLWRGFMALLTLQTC